MYHDAIAAKGSVRTLTAGELPLLREHLLRLDPESRHDRFNGHADDGFVARYAAQCESDGTIVVAYIDDGAVRGVAELHQPGLCDPMPEIAFTVETGHRRQGVGSVLFVRLIAKARSLGYDSLRITTGSQNGAMRALAHKFGAHLSFARGESSGSIDLKAGRAVGAATPLEAARAMMNFNRACWVLFFRFYGIGRTA
jgi:GNAT superfamily N-acetyltransferase